VDMRFRIVSSPFQAMEPIARAHRMKTEDDRTSNRRVEFVRLAE